MMLVLDFNLDRAAAERMPRRDLAGDEANTLLSDRFWGQVQFEVNGATVYLGQAYALDFVRAVLLTVTAADRSGVGEYVTSFGDFGFKLVMSDDAASILPLKKVTWGFEVIETDRPQFEPWEQRRPEHIIWHSEARARRSEVLAAVPMFTLRVLDDLGAQFGRLAENPFILHLRGLAEEVLRKYPPLPILVPAGDLPDLQEDRELALDVLSERSTLIWSYGGLADVVGLPIYVDIATMDAPTSSADLSMRGSEVVIDVLLAEPNLRDATVAERRAHIEQTMDSAVRKLLETYDLRGCPLYARVGSLSS